MAKRTKENKRRLALDMVMADPKPNQMFPEWMTERLKFLHYSSAVPCAECGKKRRRHWTMMCSFRVGKMGQFAISKGDKLHMPMTPVCDDHILEPEVVEV